MSRHPLSRLAPALAAVVLLAAACGDDDTSDTSETSATSDTVVEDVELVPGASTATTEPPAEQPEVSIPESLPTELVVTDLVTGDGPAATVGDTVVVDYVGVRTEDGEQFDSSYGRRPFPVTLGEGSVIAGWEQGLVGAQAGGRRQLDIPSELAYGDQAPPGGVIRPGDALTFVVDVRAVIPRPEAADAPLDVEVEPSVGATETTTTDVTVGDGDTLDAGEAAAINVLLYRGDNAALLFNSWEQGDTLQLQLVEGASLPGLVEGLEGMRVGGRRIIVMPPDAAFGQEGNPQAGLPADTDLVAVVDLVAVY